MFVVVGGSAAANVVQQGTRSLDAPGYVLLLAAGLAIPLAIPWPVPAFALALGATTAVYGLGYSGASTVYLAILAVLFLTATPLHARRSAVMWLLVAATVIARAVVASGLTGLSPDPGKLSALGWSAAAILAGYALASHRAYVKSVEERARNAEETRELEAQRRVTEERLRIARELHDVVSHTISLINVQAGVAAHVIDQRPEQAGAALEAIKQASKEALRELRGILGVLRQVDEDEARTPAPSLADLEDLVDSTRRAGLSVSLSIAGPPRHLSPTAELTVYRIVQESLTNVLRYTQGGSAQVHLCYDDDRLTLDVVDSGPPAIDPVSGSGHGIIGMRERAIAAGGQLAAGPRLEGGFRVHAVFPVSA
jgi:signal transduction histidine kinase